MPIMSQMPSAAPGARNLITDVPGLKVGQASDAAARTGVSVILPDDRAVAGCDAFGSFMLRPSATRSASLPSTLPRVARIRVRTCSKLHLESSKTRALAMCACSISVWDLKNNRAWL